MNQQLLTNKLSTEQYLSYFPDNWFFSKYEPTNDSKPTYDRLGYDPDKLHELNTGGHCAVWATINSFKGASSRKVDEVTKLNGCYLDFDLAKDGDGSSIEEIEKRKDVALSALLELSVRPNIVTVTKNGLQPIWLIDEADISLTIKELHEHVNKGIIDWSKQYGGMGDSCFDIPRILRIPGFFHLKAEPFLIESYLIHESKSKLSMLAEQFPYDNYEQVKEDNAEVSKELKNLNDVDIREIVIKALKEWGEPEAYFDDKARIVIKRGVTGAFQGKRDDRQYIGSASHDIPSGNKITFVKRLLELKNNKEAYKWIKDKFNLSSSTPTIQLTDTTNAEKIAEKYDGKLRFDHKRRRWLIWDKHMWKPDKNGAIERCAIESAREQLRESVDIENNAEKEKRVRWAIQSENRQKIEAAVSIAKNIEPIADEGENWDSDRLLLSCSNGIVELKTGKLRDGKPEDRITMSTNTLFEPKALCPRWEQFIDEIFEGNSELIHYVHKALGYSISGDMSEQVAFFGFGTGSNGKSVLFTTMKDVLGDYSHSVPASTFQRSLNNTNTNDVAAIEFKRFLISAETLSSSKINEQRMKKWSGGDAETARYLYGEYFTFYPACKIWLFLNHKPQIEDDSFGFWRRVRLIPFNRKFTAQEMDKHLGEKLVAEYPGILNWLVEGFQLWQKEGLDPTPDIVSRATKDYQTENDELAEFVLDRCVEGENYNERASVLYKTYQKWAEDQSLTGADVLSQTKFGRRMSDKYEKKQTNKGSVYQGITLKENTDAFPSGGFEQKAEPEVVGLSEITITPKETISHEGLYENSETHHSQAKYLDRPTTIDNMTVDNMSDSELRAIFQ